MSNKLDPQCGRVDRAATLCLAVLVGFGGQLTPGFAQTVRLAENATAPAAEDAGGSAGALEEIVVTAQRRSEKLQNVPIAISAVTGNMMADSGIEVGSDLPRIIPGLELESGGGYSNPYIRGVGTQFPNLGLESSVATYLDDQYMSRPVSGFYSFNDIDRVEVLMGPQGTLYGRNSAAGAIRIITNDPTDQFMARVGVTTGSFDRFGYDAVANIPFSDRVMGRVAVYYDSNDGYVKDYYTGRREQSRNILMTRAKLKILATDRLTIKVSVDYDNKDDTEGIAFQNLYGAPEQQGIALGGKGTTGFYTVATSLPGQTNGGYGRYGDWKPYIRVVQMGTQIRADLNMDFATLSSISGWRYSRMDEASDLTETTLPLLHDFYNERSDSYSQEFQLASNESGRLNWITGLFYYQEYGRTEYDLFGINLDEGFGVTPGPDVGGYGGVAENAVGNVKTTAYAPFAQATYKLTDQFDLTLGARYSEESKTLENNSVFITGLGPIIPIFSQAGLEEKFNNFSPRVVLSYKPAKDELFYLSYSKGFKSGGINTPAFGPAQTVKPENLTSYEVGWKTQFEQFRFNGAAFFYNYKDLQVQTINQSTGGNQVDNAATARIWGIQSDLLYAPTKSFQVGLGGMYLNSRFTDFIGEANVAAVSTPECAAAGGGLAPACLGFVTQSADFSGVALPLAPKFSGYLRTQYDLNLGSGRGSLSLNALFSYTTAYNFETDGLLRQPSTHVLSAGAKWKSDNGKLAISIFGDNLIGQEYDVFQAALGLGAFHVAAPPRTWGAKAEYTF
jgi:iron complex outermembrane receptor protein